MSANKNKKWDRCVELLRMIGCKRPIHDGKYGFIAINNKGGIARDNPELVELVTRGLIEIPLGKTPPKWSRRFTSMFGEKSDPDTGLYPSLTRAPRLFAHVTASGWALLASLPAATTEYVITARPPACRLGKYKFYTETNIAKWFGNFNRKIKRQRFRAR